MRGYFEEDKQSVKVLNSHASEYILFLQLANIYDLANLSKLYRIW